MLSFLFVCAWAMPHVLYLSCGIPFLVWTTDIKPKMLSGVQPGNGTPHDKYNIRGIAQARTNRKDDIFIQRQLVQNFTSILEWGKGLVY